MAARRTQTSFKTITEVIEHEKEFANLRVRLKDQYVVEDFEKIFPELTKIAKAVKVQNTVLYLKVDNSVWKSELNLGKNIIIEKINKYFNESVIKSIKFL